MPTDTTGPAGFSDLMRFDSVDWKTIPDQPGVYIIYDTDTVLYVGMAGRDGGGSLRKRLKDHSTGQVVNMFAQYAEAAGRALAARAWEHEARRWPVVAGAGSEEAPADRRAAHRRRRARAPGRQEVGAADDGVGSDRSEDRGARTTEAHESADHREDQRGAVAA